MYHHFIGTHIVKKNYVYTNLCKCAKKYKTRDFNSPRNDSLIVIYYSSHKIEEYFHLRNPDNINISEKYTTWDIIFLINSMVELVKSIEQGMIAIQEKVIELYNEVLKQSICIYKLIREYISTQKSLHQLFFILNNIDAIVKQSSENPTRCPSVLISGSQYMEESSFLSTPGNSSLSYQGVVSDVMYEPTTKKNHSLAATIINAADDANLDAKMIITQ